MDRSETINDEHNRLVRRTDELKQDTANLSIDVTRFDQAAHDRLRAALKRHHADLIAHHKTFSNTMV